MGTIFSPSPEKKLFLYSCGTSIYFRTAVNAEITRPLILCNDFSSSLSSAIFQDIIYFSYQNINGDLILRNVLDTNILFSLLSSESPGYFSPFLIPYDKEILFLFFVENPLSGQYLLKYTCPLDPKHTIHDIHTFCSIPTIHWIPLDNTVLLSCHSTNEFCLFHFETKEYFQNMKLISVNEELAVKLQSEDIINQKDNELLKLKTEISEKEKELFQKNKIIESAKQQYEDLMNTAYRYREEAEKWYTRYYSRK